MRERLLSVWRWLQALTPRTVLLAGFAWFVLYAFPGYMSNDSTVQLVEARTGKFSDGNPPLMAAEWWILDKIIAGPVLMLLLQGALLLGGTYFLLRRLLAPRAAAWTSAAIFTFPPVMVTMAVIWKDSQMAAYLVAGTAALIQPRLRFRMLGLGLLIAACSLRHNAVAAVIPLIALLFEWRTGLAWTKRLAIIGLTVVVVGLAGFGVTRLLASKHVRLTPAFTDIVGTIAYSDKRSDEDLLRALRGVKLAGEDQLQLHAQILTEQHHGWLVMSGPDPFFRSPETDADWDAVNRAWKELVLGDVDAYLSYHREQFLRLLHFSDDDLPGAVWNLFLEGDEHMSWVDHNASHSWFQAWFGFRILYWLDAHTPLFHPWVYAVLAVILLPLCRSRVPVALFSSGILYELGFFPVGVEPEYRYSHWMVLATVLGVVVLFIQRRGRR